MSAGVFDFGSYSCRAGLAGEALPSIVYNSEVGIPKEKSSLKPDFYVGDILIDQRREFTIKKPIFDGTIQDISMASSLFKYAFDFFNDPNNCPEEEVDPSMPIFISPLMRNGVLLTEPTLNPKMNRERMTTLMFERFQVPYFLLSVQPILSLFACEKTDGLVIDSGASLTQFIPVYEGFVLSTSYKSQHVAGENITDYLVSLISEKRDVDLTTYKCRQLIENEIKMDCMIAEDAEDLERMSNDENLARSYTLPDGSTFTIEEERFLAPEILFRPEMFISDDSMVEGIDQACYDCIMGCDIDVRRRLFENICCVGGNTLYPGFGKRVERGVKGFIQGENVEVNVMEPEDRDYSSWIGGSILASISSFQQMAISKMEYDEIGSAVINAKCKITWDN